MGYSTTSPRTTAAALTRMGLVMLLVVLLPIVVDAPDRKADAHSVVITARCSAHFHVTTWARRPDSAPWTWAWTYSSTSTTESRHRHYQSTSSFSSNPSALAIA